MAKASFLEYDLLSETWHKNDSPMQEYQCKCQHNTCGPLCDQCCPVFNQKRWRPGKFVTGNECERCQCFGHADECFFDPQAGSRKKTELQSEKGN